MHTRTAGLAWRGGTTSGLDYLVDQKLSITVPRVRDLHAGTELPLAACTQLQTPRAEDVGLFRRVLAGVSAREYEAAAEAVPEAFGIAKSSVSRRFICASADGLKQFHARCHEDRERRVLLLDGKTFADDQVVIACGVTTDGEKRVLGRVQTAMENKLACAAFARELVERGFTAPKGLLVVLDGAKCLGAAVCDVFGDDVAVQRCQWHKREKVLSYLPKSKHPEWRWKLQAACAHGAYAEAKRALQQLVSQITNLKESAARSLEEGLDETFTLHRLGLHEELRRSLTTANLIESVMAQIERKTQRVDHWRTSERKQRWCAATLSRSNKTFAAFAVSNIWPCFKPH